MRKKRGGLLRKKFNPRNLPVTMRTVMMQRWLEWYVIVLSHPHLQVRVIQNYINRTGRIPLKLFKFRGE